MSQVELKLKSGLPLCKKVILEEARVWLNRRDLSKAVVEIEVVSKKRIRSLNKKFLGHDLATDVLLAGFQEKPRMSYCLERFLSVMI